jgi:hypothetical protein
MLSKPAKACYSETEAAAAIGVTVEQLRSLIEDHIVARGEAFANSPVLTFQRSDLLLLKFLAGQQAQPRD